MIKEKFGDVIPEAEMTNLQELVKVSTDRLIRNFPAEPDKYQELKDAVREYLKYKSTDGKQIRQELRKKLEEMVK